MKQPIRVLHIVGSMNVGGVETWLMQVLRHINRSKYQLDFCCLGGNAGFFAPEIKALGSQMHVLKLTCNLFDFNSQFSRILESGRYTVLHSHVQFFTGYILRQAFQCDVPTRIAHSHNTRDGKRDTLGREAYRRIQRQWIKKYSTTRAAASSDAGHALFGKSDAKNQTKFVVIPLGLDLRPFEVSVNSNLIRTSLGIPQDAKVVGHIGRFDSPKNHTFLIDIARELIPQAQDIWFLLIGDGPLRGSIQTKIREFGLENRVILTGLRTDIVNLLLGAIDIFVMPSMHEGLPVVLVEAQAAGLPCIISTDITRDAEIVPGLVKFLSRAEGASKWAEVVRQRMVEKKMEREKTHAALRERHYDIEGAVEILTSLYRR